jgi:TonB family protein
VDDLPEAITKQPPRYPDRAREQNVDGTVIVAALVCEHGRVRDMRVRKSVPLLDEESLWTVSLWVFRPARRAGVAVPHWTDVPV